MMYDDYEKDYCDEGPKTWKLHHLHWTAEAIREMRMTGEWSEDLDAEDEEDPDEETEDDDE